MIDPKRLRDSRVFKLLAVVTTVILAASNGIVALAGGLRDGSIRGGSDGSRKLWGWESKNVGGSDSDNDWSSVNISSKTSKCAKSGGGVSSVWSAGSDNGETGAKAGKGRRRLGGTWGRVWTTPASEDDETQWQPSWGADSDGSWSDDDDCDESANDGSESDLLYFVKSGKAMGSKSSKSKSSKKSKSASESKSFKSSLTEMTSNTNNWSSDWNPPIKSTDRAWSTQWTPPSEPSWGSSKWTASPTTTVAQVPTPQETAMPVQATPIEVETQNVS